jgi:hypothetical protein
VFAELVSFRPQLKAAVLVDREGKIIALIVGVGGFLGMGEKLKGRIYHFPDLTAAGSIPAAPSCQPRPNVALHEELRSRERR